LVLQICAVTKFDQRREAEGMHAFDLSLGWAIESSTFASASALE